MIHYYIKRRLVESPVKTLCEGVWLSRPRSHQLRLSLIDCPKCLEILIKLQEKRLALLQANYLRAIKPAEATQ